MKILFDGTNGPVQRTIITSLRGTGYEVNCIRAGESLHEALASAPYDLLILEHECPASASIRTIVNIRDEDAHEHLPIILISDEISHEMKKCADGFRFDLQDRRCIHIDLLLTAIRDVELGLQSPA